jgi:tellurite resistance protein TehA-like permease
MSAQSEESWVAAGMTGASFVAVTQLATRSDLNFMHKAAIALFALCLPCLVLSAGVWRNPPKDATEQRISSLFDGVFLIATLCFCVAVFCLFASFGFVYPIARLCSAVLR